LKITEPNEVGSVWPLTGKDKQVLEDIVAKINDHLSEREKGLKYYEGLVTIDLPANYNMAKSAKVITCTTAAKFREAKWRCAELNLFESNPLQATFKFLLVR